MKSHMNILYREFFNKIVDTQSTYLLIVLVRTIFCGIILSTTSYKYTPMLLKMLQSKSMNYLCIITRISHFAVTMLLQECRVQAHCDGERECLISRWKAEQFDLVNHII